MVTNVAELNTACKSAIFKSILVDVIYSFRMSMKKLTGANTDIRLEQIRVAPIHIEGAVVIGRIKNLVGGKIACGFDKKMVDFLNKHSEYDSGKFTPSEIFAIDFFDSFTTNSKSAMLELSTDSIEMSNSWVGDSSYYIRFDTKIITKEGDVIPSKFIISVDEIASMYLKEY